MRQPKSAPYQAGTGKDCLDFFRGGIGRYIIILGYLTQQQIANTAPHNIGFISIFLKTANDLGCMRAELLNRDAMLGEWNNNVLGNNAFPKTLDKYCRSTLYTG